MYKLEFVRKKKRNRRVAIGTIVGSIGVAVFCIVAFLGNEIGTFTVNLKNNGVSISLDRHSDFSNPTTHLSETGLERFTGACTYTWFQTVDSMSFDKIDNENTDSSIGQESKSDGIIFFKFTFFIRNTGDLNTSYDMDINLTENIAPKNGAYAIDEYLRLLIFEEGSSNRIYAKQSLTRTMDLEGNHKEYVCKSTDPIGEAEPFKDDTTLASITNTLEPNAFRRYTLLFWLEGEDPECVTIPDTATLKIGATINAYPQNQKAD